MTLPPRNTATRDRHRRTLARTRPPCGICGGPIDYDLPSDNPRAFVVDHRVPLALGGPDALGNKQAAHRDCNRTKGAKLNADIIRRSPSIRRP